MTRILLPANDGSRWIESRVDNDFASLGLNSPSAPAPATEIVLEKVSCRREKPLFMLFGLEPPAFTQHQVCDFIRELEPPEHLEFYVVLFPFSFRGDGYVAEIREPSAVGKVPPIYLHELHDSFRPFSEDCIFAVRMGARP